MAQRLFKLARLSWLLLALLLRPSVGLSGGLAIVTDQENIQVALELEALIRKSNCFKDLKPPLDIKPQFVPSSRLADCKFTPPRNVFGCSSKTFSQLALETNSVKVIVIKEHRDFGGGAAIGGLGAACTTEAGARCGLHEGLHSIAGAQDEYAYRDAAEANVYCRDNVLALNIAMFKDKPPYATDSKARSMHSHQIPWYSRINAKLITTGSNLGTPEPRKVGLYRAQVCEKATNGVKSWRADEGGLIPSIMETLAEGAEVPKSLCPAIEQIFKEWDGVQTSALQGPQEIDAVR